MLYQKTAYQKGITKGSMMEAVHVRVGCGEIESGAL